MALQLPAVGLPRASNTKCRPYQSISYNKNCRHRNAQARLALLSSDNKARKQLSSSRMDDSFLSKRTRPSVVSELISAPYSVVITGSTKGIGLSLAKEFLNSGDKVIICSRSADNVQASVEALEKEYGKNRVAGTPCDVSKAEDVGKLADFAVSSFGKIDIWVNNAGSNAYTFGPIIESNEKDLAEIVTTNTLGVMLCCKQAIQVMRSQASGGHIFNMDGAGADGNPTPRFAAYGATKRGLAQFTKSLQAELKMLNSQQVVVHNLSPGMVTTELLMAGSDTKQAKFFINALAEPPEEVAAFLVPRVREVVGSNTRNSSYIRFLTGPKACSQLFGRLLFQARKDKYVLED